MSHPALELRNVSFRANGRLILDRVNWTVKRGEHWTLLGPNGAGKSTLLKIACGYLWPNAGGEVLRDGRSLLDLRELRKSIGYVTSTLVSEIPPREKVLDTVLSGEFAQLGLMEAPDDADRRHARACLEELGCLDLTDKPFGVLSQGEAQKVLIARARMAKPFLIILDEPCAGLDPGARERFLAAIQRLCDRENCASLILVTHHVEEIMPAFERTIALKAGKVLARGATAQVVRSDLLTRLYGCQVEATRQNERYSLRLF